MSLLAPLYVAGLLAVSLPIIFHLIRRTPQGRQPFSSLMFLVASPPRLTRRSRINNLLLLILRGLALTILACAFARPFFYQDSDLTVADVQGRRVAVLLDTSASMRRSDLWARACQRVEETIAELEAGDELALFTFDDQVRPLLTFSEWSELEPTARLAAPRLTLAAVKPTWGRTNLGDALATVADTLADPHSAAAAGAIRRQIILISDLQQGSRVESLQGYEWPDGVLVDIRHVAAEDPSNASIQLVREGEEAGQEADKGIRIRVSNEAGSKREQFSIAWSSAQGPTGPAKASSVYLTPGRSKTVRVPWPAKRGAADRLVLEGDAHAFDNTLYAVPPRTENVRLLFVGNDEAGDAQGLKYYLQGSLVDTATRTAELIARRGDQVIDAADLLDTRLVVVAVNPSDESVAQLRKYMEDGGRLLCVLRDTTAAIGAAKLLERDLLEVSEAAPASYALLGRVTFEHPVFAPFADPRFSDFTTIRFWKHRRLQLAGDESARVLAAFDNGDPFLVEYKIGDGTLLIATAGWHPADSQLALSTKFVPLMAGLIGRAGSAIGESRYFVDDRIDLPAASDNEERSVRTPGGDTVSIARGLATFDGTDEPGIYHFSLSGEEVPIAVNLRAEESRTGALAREELEQRGVRLGIQPSAEDLAVVERQLKMHELEQRQQLWRWLIVGVLGVLVAETALAGRLSRQTQQQVTA